jgi:hypothetical protein
MPFDKQISNPAGAYGLTADPAGQIIIEVVNNSGGTLVEGDVVVCVDVNGVLVTTTTSGNDTSVVGVVGAGAQTAPALGAAGGPGAIGSSLAAASNTGTYAIGANMPVVVEGPARVNIGANTVAAKAVLTSFTSAKQAQTVAAAVGQIGAVIGMALESQAAKDANNTIRAWIKRG